MRLVICPKHSTLGEASCTLELGLGQGSGLVWFLLYFDIIYIGFFMNDIYKVQAKGIG